MGGVRGTAQAQLPGHELLSCYSSEAPGKRGVRSQNLSGKVVKKVPLTKGKNNPRQPEGEVKLKAPGTPWRPPPGLALSRTYQNPGNREGCF